MTRTEKIVVAVICLAVILAIPGPPLLATGDSAVPWSAFSESNGCEDPYTAPPITSRVGFLPDSEPVLGPFGTYFGRTIDTVPTVSWVVPYSGGEVVKVHQRALPAFQAVTAGLAVEAAQGNIYPMNPNGALVPRTVGGAYRMSRHALGLSIDINSSTNPFRGDGRLITDMPDWFVSVWRDAGFCWGGDWVDVKDPMHFSWIGPKAGNLEMEYLEPIPPMTSSAPFADRSTSSPTVYTSSTRGEREFFVADLSGLGSPSAVAIRPTPGGAIIESVSARDSWQGCSVDRWVVPSLAFQNPDFSTLVDIDADSRPDLIVVREVGGMLDISVAVRRTEFEEVAMFSIPAPFSVRHIAGADFDGDHFGDLWLVGLSGEVAVALGPDFETVIALSDLPGDMESLALGDVDLDGDRDAVVDVGEELTVFLLDGTTWTQSQVITSSASGTHAVIDYDGDGRADLVELTGSGLLIAHFGNEELGFPSERWMFNPDFECDEEPILLFDGTFFDDDGNIFEQDIEVIVQLNVTYGCNPPFNDQFCVDMDVSRGQMAAFLARALNLPSAERDWFVDDAGSTYEEVINRLADAGITFGCNPPNNDNFCPTDGVSRAQMAAFMVRALNLSPTATDYFSDDNGSTLEADINAFAEAGLTSGCGVGSYCPSRNVTRGEMAAFLARAFG